jgi:hypothetical protein
VFEARGKIREALFLRIYEKSIENVLKTEPKAVEEGILSALSGEAAQRSQNHISNAPDNISCVLVPVGPMMNTPVLALVADGHTGPEAAVYLKENLVNMLDFTLVSEANATSEASTPINKF